MRIEIGQVNDWAEQAKDKGRGYLLAALDVFLQQRSGGNAAAEQQPADAGVQEHQHHAGNPNPGYYEDQNLRRIGAVAGRRGHGGGQYRVDRMVDGGDAGLNLRRRRIDKFPGDRLTAGDQAQRAFRGYRTDQPQRDKTP